MSYMPSVCVEWLLRVWPTLLESTQAIIQRDVEEAFREDDADRAEGRECYRLGMECDRREWERVRGLWQDRANGQASQSPDG
jgi:hypothetical protein